MIKPLISIALCTFNGEQYLTEQLNSLVNQRYPNIEIVVVDDQSTDGTLEILESYALKYRNINLRKNEANLGYIKNFERAIGLCKGEFIALADQDDIWELNKIDLMYELIGRHSLIYHDSQFIDAQGKSMDKKLSDIVNFYNGNSPDAFVFFNCISSHALMFNRSLINALFPFPTSNLHDAWIAFVASNVGSITYLKECLVHYRNHATNTTDILRKKNIKADRKERFVKEIDWLTNCRDFTPQKDNTFLKNVVDLFKRKSGNFFPIIFLFLANYENIFPIYKRSFLSKLNFILKKSLRANHD